LTASYRLLEALGDDMGKIFKGRETRFLDIQSSRNYSYLTHGFQASKDKTYEDLRQFMLDLGIMRTDDLPVFPIMEA
jgi:hypothetical protein